VGQFCNAKFLEECAVSCPFWTASLKGANGVKRKSDETLKIANSMVLSTASAARARDHKMSEFAYRISTILFHHGTKWEDIDRLSKLGICMSPESTVAFQTKMGGSWCVKLFAWKSELEKRKTAALALKKVLEHATGHCSRRDLQMLTKTFCKETSNTNTDEVEPEVEVATVVETLTPDIAPEVATPEGKVATVMEAFTLERNKVVTTPIDTLSPDTVPKGEVAAVSEAFALKADEEVTTAVETLTPSDTAPEAATPEVEVEVATILEAFTLEPDKVHVVTTAGEMTPDTAPQGEVTTIMEALTQDQEAEGRGMTVNNGLNTGAHLLEYLTDVLDGISQGGVLTIAVLKEALKQLLSTKGPSYK